VIDEAALADFVAEGVVEPPARPRAIVVIGEMPVTPVGKIFKPRLRELAAERAARELLAGVVCEVTATHDKRGLLLKVTAPASAVAAARAELGKLPVAFEVVST
jgi:fatty-acyl-CoA synthase